MRVGVPKEIKSHEYRVGLTDGSVRELVEHGHTVLVETNAGAAIGMTDDDYRQRGAEVVSSADEVFESCELIVKVKEPQPEECARLRDGQILFTYLHLAPNRSLVELLLESRATAIAYETVTGPGNSLPLLAPMSEVAGRLSIQAGAHCLERDQGGQGILLGGVPGVAPGKILIIGGGTVGDNAAHVARGLGADVTILDRSIERLRELDHEHEGTVKCVYSKSETIEKYALDADLVIGAVLVPGATAAKVLTHDIVRRMKPGSVFVDVAIDQGGCSETSRPTTHQDPTYVTDGVVHYCVTNMPGVVPKTSTLALNNTTLPFVVALADLGLKDALAQDPHLANGLNIHAGKVTHPAVARDLGYDYTSPESVL
jgi:alanine dehydrogenase